MGPLHGIRVLDLTRFISGPNCTMMLGDLGADVIKVEQPKVGDGTRRWAVAGLGTENPYYLSVNRNKRSIAVDLKHRDGGELLAQLAEQSDVFIHNMRARVFDGTGLSYEALSKRNPKLVYCEISGYGDAGPHKERGSFDFTMQAESGLMSLNGEPDGMPSKIGAPFLDVLTSLVACNAIQAALLERTRTGKGSRVSTSMLETVVAAMPNIVSDYLVADIVPERWGNNHPNLAPYGAYRASDGWFALGVATEPQWQRLCELLGKPDLATDPRFATNPVRLQNRAALDDELAPPLATRPKADWLGELARRDITHAPINTIPEVLADEQAAAIALVKHVTHPQLGEIRLVRSPIVVNGEHLPIKRVPPTLGQHTDEVLRELLSLGDARVAQLRAAGAVG